MGAAFSGVTAIGALGDPCALLTVAELEAGTGYRAAATGGLVGVTLTGVDTSSTSASRTDGVERMLRSAYGKA